MSARQNVIATAVGVASLAASAYLCRPAAPIELPRCVPIARDADHDPQGRDIAHLVTLEGTGAFDYSNGMWIAESGDGRIVGYAAAEDSTVYTTRNCAERSN